MPQDAMMEKLMVTFHWLPLILSCAWSGPGLTTSRSWHLSSTWIYLLAIFGRGHVQWLVVGVCDAINVEELFRDRLMTVPDSKLCRTWYIVLVLDQGRQLRRDPMSLHS